MTGRRPAGHSAHAVGRRFATMAAAMSDPAEFPFVIRTFRPPDAAACRRLYVDGLIGGKIADNDTGYDIDAIEAAYLKHPGCHFWVAVAPEGGGPPGAAPAAGEVVGMIGVQAHDEGVGEVRRLRVAASHRRRGIGSALVETALRFCQERHCLKITLDTYMDREPAVQLFKKFRFRLDRTRRVGDKELSYFYLDLYGRRPG